MFHHRAAAQRLRRILAQVVHDPGHLFHTGLALKGVADHCVVIVAVVGVNFVHHIAQTQPLQLVVGGHFANEHTGHHGVLIPGMGAGQIAVAFLKAHHKVVCTALGLQLRHHLADVLKSGEQILKGAAVAGGNGLGQIGGYKGLHRHAVLAQSAFLLSHFQQVIQQHSAHFVAAHQPYFAPLHHRNAYPVAVRVGCQQQIGVDIFVHFQCQFKGLLNLRVRVGAGGEVAVRQLLLRHHIHVGHADPVKDRPYRLIAGAV